MCTVWKWKQWEWAWSEHRVSAAIVRDGWPSRRWSLTRDCARDQRIPHHHDPTPSQTAHFHLLHSILSLSPLTNSPMQTSLTDVFNFNGSKGHILHLRQITVLLFLFLLVVESSSTSDGKIYNNVWYVEAQLDNSPYVI